MLIINIAAIKVSGNSIKFKFDEYVAKFFKINMAFMPLNIILLSCEIEHDRIVTG
jgi:hypothetical protein